MRLFLATRRAPVLAAASVAVAVLPLVSRVTVAFPGILGGGEGSVVSLSALAPLVLALVFAWSLTARRTHLSDTAVRRTGWADTALLVAANLVVLGISLLRPEPDLTLARNALLLTGVSALVASLASPVTAGAITTFLVLFVVTYGRSAPGARLVRVLQAPPDASWPLAAALLLTLAACVSLTAGSPGIVRRTGAARGPCEPVGQVREGLGELGWADDVEVGVEAGEGGGKTHP